MHHQNLLLQTKIFNVIVRHTVHSEGLQLWAISVLTLKNLRLLKFRWICLTREPVKGYSWTSEEFSREALGLGILICWVTNVANWAEHERASKWASFWGGQSAEIRVVKRRAEKRPAQRRLWITCNLSAIFDKYLKRSTKIFWGYSNWSILLKCHEGSIVHHVTWLNSLIKNLLTNQGN